MFSAVLLLTVVLVVIAGHLFFTMRRWLTEGVARIPTNRHGWSGGTDLQFFREEEPASFWSVIVACVLLHGLAAFVVIGAVIARYDLI